jgi:putative transposase
MQCIGCGSTAVSERNERTTQGYRRFRCRACGKQFNERSESLLSRTQYPSDVMAAAKAFFQSAKTVTDVIPDRVITDGHDSYPRAIRAKLGEGVKHRTSCYLNNRLEQDHRGIKGRYQPMRGFKCPRSADRFCRGYDELHNLLRPRSRPHQHISANNRRLHFLRRIATVVGLL